MDKINIEIFEITKPYYFVYNNEGFVIKPTHKGNSKTYLNKKEIDIIVDCNSISELNAELQLRGLNFDVNNINNPLYIPWHIQDDLRTLRIYMTYAQYLSLLASTETYNETPIGILLLSKLHFIQAPIIEDNNGYYIYLEYIEDEIKDIFVSYNAKFEYKNENF